jgi:hypothetical protein
MDWRIRSRTIRRRRYDGVVMGMYFDPVSGQWYPGPTAPPLGLIQVGVVDVIGEALSSGDMMLAAMEPGVPTRLTVTIDQDGLRDGQTQRAERIQALEMLWRCGQALASTTALSGDVADRNGVVTGHWNYIPTASG